MGISKEKQIEYENILKDPKYAKDLEKVGKLFKKYIQAYQELYDKVKAEYETKKPL